MKTPRSTLGSTAAGFTLLEALIATALMGMILAALAAIAAQWLPNWSRGMVRVQRSEHTALGLERLVADLAAAEFVPAGRQSRQPLFSGTDRSVIFVRTALGPNTGPGLEIVRVAEVASERGPVLVRMRAPFVPASIAAVDPPEANFSDPVILLRAPYRLSFSYAGPNRIWQDTWQQQMQLPRTVKLTLRDLETQRTLSVSTAASVHAELPAECIAAKSFAACLASRPQPSRSGAVRGSRS